MPCASRMRSVSQPTVRGNRAVDTRNAANNTRRHHGSRADGVCSARPCNLGAQTCRLIRRTAVCGPARTVVWEGRSREALSYPDCSPRYVGNLRKGSKDVQQMSPVRPAVCWDANFGTGNGPITYDKSASKYRHRYRWNKVERSNLVSVQHVEPGRHQRGGTKHLGSENEGDCEGHLRIGQHGLSPLCRDQGLA